MTAIKGPVVDRTGVRAPSKRGLSSAGASERNLSSAKQHFMDAVKEGVDKLMRRCGYSRERATRTILHELSCGDIPVNDDEVSGELHASRFQCSSRSWDCGGRTLKKAAQVVGRSVRDGTCSLTAFISTQPGIGVVSNFSCGRRWVFLPQKTHILTDTFCLLFGRYIT